MNSQATSVVPPGSMFIRASRAVVPGSGLAPVSATGVQLWPASQPPNVATPSGTAVLQPTTCQIGLAGLPSAGSATVFMPTGSNSASPFSMPSVVSSAGNAPLRLAHTPSTTQTVLHGPNGPIAVTLPAALLPGSFITASSTNRVETAQPNTCTTDGSCSNIMENHACTSAGVCSAPNIVIPQGQTLYPTTEVTSATSVNTIPLQSASNFPPNVISSPAMGLNPSTMLFTTVPNTGGQQGGVSSDSRPANPVSISSNNLSCNSVVENSTNSQETKEGTPGMADLPSTAHTVGSNIPAGSIFTPASLSQLISEVDPQLQLDNDTEESLMQLADEFLESVAKRAHKMACHRGASAIEVKDIQFTLEREWNITVPGFPYEDRSLKRPSMLDVHRQRLAVIKKQIRKM